MLFYFRKMKSAIICLFLATSVLAQHGHYPYQGGNLPLDHHDDVYNRDLSTLVYNFEQLRRDQPPQIEAREEDLGRYIYRPRTTTVAAPPMLDFPAHIPEVKLLPEPSRPSIIGASTTKPFIGQTWNQIINKHLPATIPPPPAPKWLDLSDSLKNREVYQPHYSPVQQVLPMPMYHQKVSQMPAEPLPYSAYSQYSGVEYVPTTTTTTAAPYSHYMQNSEPYFQQSVPRTPARQSRGQHKFSWGDVLPTESKQPAVTTPAPVAYNPASRKINLPSSMPTLTPWSGDNFGK
ncbi:uncharacterized protein LOC128670749 [Plodia interpunctella]|uniref:uncharacterized protein LOC128670749 n=1 Tax=Plodia interpunctella TaxID=58824 RepID=UPI0023684726|nr:uncharacterized protein LOC128670749 [Plodia interpunctella]